MRIRTIEGRCSGHARCSMVAPDIYLLNEDGYLELPETHVQQENEAITQRGARACPERAIEVIED